MNLQSSLSDDSKPKNTAPTTSQTDRSRPNNDSSNIDQDSTSNNILEFSARFKKNASIPRTTASISSVNNKISDLSQAKPSSSQHNRGISNERIPKKEPVSGTKVRTLSAEHKAKEGGGPLVLAESYLEQGYQDAENDDYIKALFNTLLAKKVIDDYLRKNWKFSFETLFITFYNLSAIHYKLRNFEECALYIKIALMNYDAHKTCNPQKMNNKASWYNFNSLQDQASYLKQVVARNVYKRYKCKIHLQGCIVNSQLGNSVDAFSHAVKAAKIACGLLFDSMLVAYHLYYKVKSYNDEHRKQRESDNSATVKTEENEVDKKTEFENTPRRRRVNTKEDSSSPGEREKSRNEWIEYFRKVIPILEEILAKVKGKKSNMPTTDGLRFLLIMRKLTSEYKFKEMNMQALYEDLPVDHFLYTSNVMAIAQLLPIWTHDLKKNQKLQDVIEVDALIEQIVLITVSVYCISTELRFWSNTKLTNGSPTTAQTELPVWKKEPLSDTRLKEASELWVGRSVSLAFVYLPHDSLLAEQIFNIYSKIYDPTKIAIPEDEEVKYNLKYLVPAKGIFKLNSSFIPIIKKDPKDDLEGLEALLALNKDLSESTTNILNEVKLFDNKAPFYELLFQNYQHDTQASDLQGLYKKFLEKNVQGGSGSGKKSGNKSLTRISTKSPNRSETSFTNLRRIYLPNATQKPEDIIQNVAMTIGKDKDKDKDKLKLFDDRKPKQKKDKEEEKNATGDSGLRVMTDPTHSESNTTAVKDLFSKAEIRSSVNKLRPIARLGFEDVKRNIQRKLLRGDQSAGSGAGTGRSSMESPGRPFEKEGPVQVFHTDTDFPREEESQQPVERPGGQQGLRNMKHMPPMVAKNHPLSQLIGDVDQRSFIRAHFKSMQMPEPGPTRNFFGKQPSTKEERSGSPNLMKRSDIPTVAITEMKTVKLRPKTAEKKRPPTGEGLSRLPLDEKLLKRVGAPLRGRVDSEGDRAKDEESNSVLKLSGRTSVDLDDMRAKTERRTEEVKTVRSGSVGRINVIRKSEVMIKKSKRAY